MTILQSSSRTISVISNGKQRNRLNNYKFYRDGEVIISYKYNKNNIGKAKEVALSWTYIPDVVDSKNGKIDVL